MSAPAATSRQREGGCLCGSVRFSAMPEQDVNACHCSMCRKWSAGPFLSIHCDNVVIADGSSLGVYASSEWAERGFCKTCGSPLFYRLVGMPFYAVSAEAFDSGPAVSLTSEIFVDEKPPYYSFANDTKKMTGPEVMAAFAANQAKG